ncbi:MAG: trigger factor [Clostridia bacterium]|nr:trigger factor [Clostridia bacterium]
MDYTITATDNGSVDIEMTFEGEEVEDAISDAYLAIRKKYTVPGFRKGRAPKNILMNYIGMRPFYMEAVDALYSKNLPYILEREKDNYKFYGTPEGDIRALEENKIVLVANIVVEPEVKISQYKGLRIRKYEPVVTDSDVEAEMKRAGESAATEEEVEGRCAENGDKVNLDFVGTVNGEAFPGGTADEYDLVLGSGSFIPGFEEQIVGMSKGEKKDITVKFPEYYDAEDLAGKDAVFSCKVNKITMKVYPEFDDAYAKKYGRCDTMDEFREKTRSKLEENAKNKARDKTENSIIDAVLEHTEVSVPERMREEEIDAIVKDFSDGLKYRYQGVTFEQYLEYLDESEETFRKGFESDAEKRIKIRLVMRKIIEDEKMEVSGDEMDKKLTEQAESIGRSFDEYKGMLSKDNLNYVANDLAITKLFDFLMENNEFYVEEGETLEN